MLEGLWLINKDDGLMTDRNRQHYSRKAAHAITLTLQSRQNFQATQVRRANTVFTWAIRFHRSHVQGHLTACIAMNYQAFTKSLLESLAQPCLENVIPLEEMDGVD